ncbi:MAG: MoxR family ATPase [Planctomycetota bacterium]
MDVITVPTAKNPTARELNRCEHQPAIEQLRARLRQSLRGKDDVVELVLASLLARGHILFEDLPGLGKTTLAKGLANAIGGVLARVQCTPDLLPGDITGFNVFNQKSREFEFVPGPVFSDILLVDEINRATPRTQSALFEAMAERQVTVDNQCRSLHRAFFVIATQNPVEHHGTYPLPEAQLDRFAVKLRIGYPDRRSEIEILGDHVGEQHFESERTEPVVDLTQLEALRQHVAAVAVRESVRAYLVDLAGVTRKHADIALGVSPRGLLVWQRMAQAFAHLRGRDFVTPDDVQDVAGPVLEVRVGLSPERFKEALAEILQAVPIPMA